MSHQKVNSSVKKHTNLAELENLKTDHFNIYKELMNHFKCDVRVCNEWLIKPKAFLQGKSPFEQLSINPDEVMGMLIRMRTGDFS